MRPSRPPNAPEAPPRDTPYGAFMLLERIAVGGMAEVFRALEPRQAGEPRSLVIKRMLPHIAAEPGSSRMFEEEGRLGGLIEHPNVVRVLGFGELDGQPYLALELVTGLDLLRASRSLRAHGRGLGIDVALFVTTELLAGLHAVHEATDADGRPLGIVHRDVSPSNVLLSVRGDVKLADFGIAEARLRSSFPQAAAAGRTKGKLGYLAPEQVRGEGSDRRADVFAAAVVASELLIGEPLFARGSELSILLAVRDAKIDPLLAKAASLPAGLIDVLSRGLSRDPEDRHASAAELRTALLPFFDGPPAALRAELGSVVSMAVGERKTDGATLATPPPDDEVTREPPLDDYVVTTATGARLGPLTFAQLVESVTRGNISRDDCVSVAGKPALALRAIPELAGHFPIRGPSMSAASDRRGMAGGGIVDALASSAARELSGVWVCTRGDARKEVYLIDGAPELVASNLASELLGEFLVARGILERGELDMALAVLPRFDGRLGDTLTALGLIEPVELFRHISDQVAEKLLELFTWTDGEARFHEGVAPPQRFFPLGLDPWQMISQGIERRLAHGLEQDTFALHMLDSLERTKTLAPEGLPSAVEGVLGETRRAVALQDLVDLLEVGDRDVHRPYRAIRLALALDLVRWV